VRIPDLQGREWTNRDFEGKATIVYLWASWCGPCWRTLSTIQVLMQRVKGRPDVQLVTLSVDEDHEKLMAFMKQKSYTFQVLASKAYVQTVLPQFILGQFWIVDGGGAVRLQRTTNNFGGAEDALIVDGGVSGVKGGHFGG
jgi:peroxiredoxin